MCVPFVELLLEAELRGHVRGRFDVRLVERVIVSVDNIPLKPGFDS